MRGQDAVHRVRLWGGRSNSSLCAGGCSRKIACRCRWCVSQCVVGQIKVQIKIQIHIGWQHAVRGAQRHSESTSGAATGLVQGVVRIEVTAQLGNAVPVRAFALRQAVNFGSDGFQCLAVLAFGINFTQLGVHRYPRRVVAHGLFENFFGLQITAVGQIHVSFGHRVHVAACIELAGRVGHGRPTRGRIGARRVHALATAGAKERIRLQTAFQEGAVHARTIAAALDYTPGTIAQQQCQQSTTGQWNHGVVHQAGDEAGFFCGSWLRHGRGHHHWLGWGRLCGFAGHRCGGLCGGCDSLGSGALGQSRFSGGCWCFRGGNAGHRNAGRRWLAGGCGGRACGTWCGRCGAELAQFADVLGQFFCAGSGLVGLLALGELFLGRLLALHGALGQRELVRSRAAGALVVYLGLNLAGSGAARCGHFGRRGSARQLAAEFIEVAALRGQNFARLTVGRGAGFGGAGQLQHGTGLEAVHVALDEGIGIRAQQCHQHLIQRYIGRAVGAGNAARGIPGFDGNAVARCGSRRGGCRARNDSGAGCWCRAGLLGCG